jgi:hypothetical protein
MLSANQRSAGTAWLSKSSAPPLWGAPPGMFISK